MVSLFLQNFNISHINQHRACQKCWRWDEDINAQDDNTGFDGNLIACTADVATFTNLGCIWEMEPYSPLPAWTARYFP
jgi:hypothetical protein